ncbi:MAG: hypothetical protein AAF741_04700 [Bacteroidota bacterium]
MSSLLANLSAAECDLASSWLACPVHNTREDIRRLFDCYRSGEQESGKAWWPTIYTDGRAYSEQDFRLLKSYLLDKLEAWLAYKQWSFNRLPQVDPFLLDAYRQRGLERHFINRLKRARRTLKSRPTTDLWTAYQIETQEFDLAAGSKRLEAHNLEERDQLLDAAVLRMKLRAACQTLSTYTLKGKRDEIALLSECLALADQPIFSAIPGIKAYSLACTMLLEPDGGDVHFESFYRLITEQLDHFPTSEQRDLLRLGINFCVGRINQEQFEFLSPSLALYRLAINRKLIYQAGEISPFTFNNVVGIALRLGENDWAEQFLNTQCVYLPDDKRASLTAFNTARLALAKEDYEGVLVALREDYYKDFIQQMNARVLKLKAYWSLELYHLLESHIRNTRSLLRRKQKTSYHVQNFKNLFDLSDQLLRLPPGPGKGKEKLHSMISKTEPLTERAWLLDQLHFNVAIGLVCTTISCLSTMGAQLFG